MQRRAFLAAAAAVGVAGCTRFTDGSNPDDGPDSTEDTPTTRPTGPDRVALETVTAGLRGPLDVAWAPDADRRYVAEQRGLVRVHEAGGLRSSPLLDLRDRVVTGYEQGLLGVAVHPGFASNRRLFVRYSSPPRSGTPPDYSHTFVLSEFVVSADGRTVDPDSERVVLTVPEPQRNHNAGSIVFGPDGYLYVGVGDGGAGGDQGTGHVDDWYDAVGGGNGQDVTENLLGSVLRIDVDAGERGDYGIPDDNPLVDRDGRDEHYAWGFRNPWRLAFDGDTLYAGDVGQNRYEEVDVVVRGGNYGWNVTEGTHCFQAQTCPDRTPEDVRGGEPLRDPVVEYPHEGASVSGISVICGNVYRGDAIPDLRGTFVFGDYRARGRLFVATPADVDDRWSTGVLPVADADAGRLQELRSIARHDGDLYVLGSGSDGGALHRLAPAES